MWNSPERKEIIPVYLTVQETSPEAILAKITKMRGERMDWDVIAKSMKMKKSDALRLYVREQMRLDREPF